jgi:hypothetical protein
MAYTPVYSSTDLAPLVFDIVGQFMAGIASNASLIVTLLILTIIIVLVVDLLTGVFGIVGKVKGLAKK